MRSFITEQLASRIVDEVFSLNEDMNAVADNLASHEDLAGGAGAFNPYNQFSYFQDQSMMGGHTGQYSDYSPEMLASAYARYLEMQRRYGEGVARGALRRAHDEISGGYAGWAPIYHAGERAEYTRQGQDMPGDYLDYQVGGRDEGRAAYNRTLARMNQAYADQANPRQSIPKGGKGAGNTTSDNRRKGR